MAHKRKQEINRAAVFEAILGELPESGGVGRGDLVTLDELRFNEQQPRKHFDPVALEDLAHSIRQKGLLEPILVRRVDGGFELVAGERRTRAARLAGLTEVPAIVVDVDDREALELAITENLQREDLNAVEETEAVLSLLSVTLDVAREDVVALLQALYSEERGRASSRKVAPHEREEVQAVFRRIGRFGVSSFVSNRLPILEFPPELLEGVRDGRIEFTKAQAIARVGDPGARRRLFGEAVKENLSLSQIRRRITELRNGAREGGAAGEFEATQRLVTGTKRLLNRRRLAVLDHERLERVKALLGELNELLSEA